MKINIKYSPRSLQDLDEIWQYIKDKLGSPIAAKNTVKGILDTVKNLENFPESGSVLFLQDQLNSGYRYVIYKSYIAFYRFECKDVFIDRIIYRKRDYLSILFKDSLFEE